MELVFQRHSWTLYALVVVLAAYLAARTVNTVVAAAIAPEPVVQQARAVLQVADQPQPLKLDAERVAKLFDVPLPKAASASTETAEEPHGPRVWNPVPVRSSLHGTLIGTAIADPHRYSLCQITNPDLNETQIYAMGDKYQSALVYRIEKERVLLDHDGVNEYIDTSGPGAPSLHGSPVPIPGVAPVQRGDAGGVRQLSPHQYVMARSELNSALTNLPDLTTKARIVPSFKNGVADGFKLFSIVPDSALADRPISGAARPSPSRSATTAPSRPPTRRDRW
ncbi:MAG TPA: type II secretion system protein N [Myxococcales bacterium]